MGEIINQYYVWVKALHLISVIAWMAGLLYLPRLFVYHADVKPGSEMSETFKIMERRLLRIIMNPAMGAAWVFGGLMIFAFPDVMDMGWMHVKLTCVLLMTIFHHALVKWWKGFNKDENKHTANFYRKMNEVPTVLMIIIVIMALVEPF